MFSILGYINSIEYLYETSTNTDGMIGTVQGYGQIDDSPNYSSAVLLYTTTEIISNHDVS
jgi:hypothetical protein